MTTSEIRDKLQKQLFEYAALFTEQAKNLPLVLEDKARKQTVYQQWGSTGPETIVRFIHEGLSPELIMAYFYNYISELPKVVTNLELTKLDQLGNRTIFHQKINTPFIFSNISIMQCQYNIHNEETGEYTFIVSSIGNEAIQQQNASRIGKDTIGEMKLNFMHFKPVKNETGAVTAMDCTHVICVNPGAVPFFVQGMMMKAHATMLSDQITYMVKNQERLLKFWEVEVKQKVLAIYEEQRPKAVIIEQPVIEQNDELEINTERGLLSDEPQILEVNNSAKEKNSSRLNHVELNVAEISPEIQDDKNDKEQDQIVKFKRIEYHATSRQESLKSAQDALKNCSRPCKLTWSNINFTVRIKNQSSFAKYTGDPFVDLQVLKNVSGYALPGQTLFIMGASGAGKTSLLNIILDRTSLRDGNKISGKVLINNRHVVKQETIGSVASFVMQDDILFEYLTVKECLQFAARLRLFRLSDQEQDVRVDQLIHELGLTNVQNLDVGSVDRKVISGGERKRTSIGVELITDPSIILLDEPTSGLDSFKAHSVVKLLRRLAREKGKTIISTIHSPSSQSFFEFDRLMFLQDGYVAFQGYASECAGYFGKIGVPCPLTYNPADFYIQKLSIDYPKGKKEIQQIEFYTTKYNEILSSAAEAEEQAFVYPDFNIDDYKNAPILTQFKQLLLRSHRGVSRNPQASKARIGQGVIIGLMILALFYKINGTDRPHRYNVAGCFFFITVNNLMMSLMGTITLFQQERPVFLREQANKMYDVAIYFNAKTLTELPLTTLQPLIVTIILYWGIGLTNTASQFFTYYFILWGLIQASMSMGYLISCIFNDFTVANMLAPILMMPFILLGGFYANLNSLPGWLVWLKWLSPIKYASEALLWNEYKNSSPEEYDLIGALGLNFGLWPAIGCNLAIAVGSKIIAIIALKSLVQKAQ